MQSVTSPAASTFVCAIGLGIITAGTSHTLIAGEPPCDHALFGRPIAVAIDGYPQSIAVGDIDGDQDPDLVVASPPHLWVLTNDGSGAFTPRTPIHLDARGSALADFDGDGDLDLAVGNGGLFQVLFNDGTGHFPDHGPLYSNAAPAIAAGDLDGDGDSDLVTADKWLEVAVSLNDGTGAFVPGRDWRVNDPFAVGIADLDGDGDQDIIASLRFGWIGVARNEGNGVFGDMIEYGSTGWLIRDIALGDVDGDLDIDAALALADGHVVVALNPGDGTLDNYRYFFTGAAQTLSIALADFNGDDALDIAAGLLMSPESERAVAVLLNTGGGSFAEPFLYRSPDAPIGIAAVDLDGDDDADLVSANYFSANVTSRLNVCFCAGDVDGSGNAAFADIVAILAKWGPCGRCPEDLDDDGVVGIGDIMLVLGNWGEC